MIEIELHQGEDVAGGLSLLGAVGIGRLIYQGVSGYIDGMSAIGGTLRNYYGADMTLEIVAAGGMGA